MHSNDNNNDTGNDTGKTDSSRRRFIAGLTAVGGLAATGAAISNSNAATPSPASSSVDTGDAGDGESIGYQDSSHVKAYYQSLRD